MAAMICVWSSPCSGVTSVMVNAILAEAATAARRWGWPYRRRRARQRRLRRPRVQPGPARVLALRDVDRPRRRRGPRERPGLQGLQGRPAPAGRPRLAGLRGRRAAAVRGYAVPEQDTVARRFVRALGTNDDALLDAIYDPDVVLYTPLAW